MSISINALPKQGITKLSTAQRLRSKLVTLDLLNTSAAQAGIAEMDGVKDLARDLYHQLVQADPHDVADTPVERAANKQLLDFARQSNYWDATRNVSVGNMLTAMQSAVIMHDALLKDEKTREAMRKQESASMDAAAAAEQQRAADVFRDAAAQTADPEARENFNQAAQEAQAKADARKADAEQSAQAAQDAISAALGDGTTKTAARIRGAMKQAAEQAKETAETMAGWGSEPGSEIKSDPQAALNYLKRIQQPNLKQIAKLAGRFKGIAMSARASRVAVGNTPFDATYTQDVTKLFSSELALLSPHAPKWLQAKKAAEFADRGLLGVDTRGEAKESGPFVSFTDVSGSMGGTRFVIAKAVALGIANVARDEDRHYILGTFGGDSDPSFTVTSKEGWQKHLEWAGYNRGGGTSFDKALRLIMENLRRFRQEFGEHIGDADALINSDGEALVSKAVADEWRVFQEEHGTRLLYVEVSDYTYDGDGVNTFSLHQIADKSIRVSDLNNLTGDELAAQIGTWIQ